MIALYVGAGTVVMAQNFDNAFLRTKPSVSAQDRQFYVNMKDRLCKARAHPPSSTPEDTTAWEAADGHEAKKR